MTTTIQMETVKDEKGNITEVFDTSRGKITAEIANPDRRIITEPDDEERLMIGGRNFKDFSWNDIFNSKKVNKLFKNYAINEYGVSPFIPNPENPSESIGMWMSVRDEVTGRVYGDVVVRESIGQLLVIMFISISCSELKDKRGHSYSVSTITGTKDVYEDFVNRVREEAPENMRNYFAYIGGLLEATVSSKAACPEKVFKYINKIID